MSEVPFLPLRKADLEDDTLFRLNYVLNLILEELARLTGSGGTIRFRGTIEAKGFRLEGAQGSEDDSAVLTMGTARKLFGPEAIRQAWISRRWMGQPVRGIAPPEIGALPSEGLTMPDVRPSDERVVDRDGNFGFSGRIEFPTLDPDYENLYGIEINFWGPLDELGNETEFTGPHIMGVLEAPKEGASVVDWTSDFWPRPAQTEYYRIRYVKVSVRGDRARNEPFESGLLAVEPLEQAHPIPDVLVFRAGTINPDGSWSQTMHWDESSFRLVVDWGVIAPEDRANWSGVALWIRTPDGSGGYLYHQASGVMDISMFRETAQGDLYYFGQHIVEPADIPDPPEIWRFIAVSYGADGRPKQDEEGNPTGPYVDLQTLPNNDVVLDFQVDVEYEVSEAGDDLFRLVGSWRLPPSPRFTGVRIVGDWPGYDEEITFAIESEGSTSFRTDAWPVPASTVNATIYAQTIYGDGSLKPKALCPSVVVTVRPQRGQTGTEYAPLVSNFQASVFYGHDETGGQLYGFQGSWSLPSDRAKFRGVKVVARKAGQPDVVLAIETEGSTSLRTDMWPVPEQAEDWTIYAVSLDANNRANSIVPGVTPSAAVRVEPARQGSLRANRIDPQTLHGSLAISLGKLGVAAQGISTDHLADLAVNASKLASGAVTEDKIVANAIKSLHIAAGQVTNQKLADLAVDAYKLATGAVTEPKIADLAVSTAKIQTAAVTSAKIAEAAVGSAAIAALAVGEAHIQTAAVTNAKIQDLAVNTAKISEVSASRLSAGTAIFTGDVTFQNTGSIMLFNGGSVYINPGTLYGTTAHFKSAIYGWEIVPGWFPEIRNAGAWGKIICGYIHVENTLYLPFQADTNIAWDPAGKIACYDTSGTFRGWIPVIR